MGTYADEDPNASIGEKLGGSVKKIVSDIATLAAPHSVTDIKEREQKATNDAETPSNTGPSGQSTDSYNKY